MAFQPSVICCRCKRRVPTRRGVDDRHCDECRYLWMQFQQLEPRFYRQGWRLRVFEVDPIRGGRIPIMGD